MCPALVVVLVVLVVLVLVQQILALWTLIPRVWVGVVLPPSLPLPPLLLPPYSLEGGEEGLPEEGG